MIMLKLTANVMRPEHTVCLTRQFQVQLQDKVSVYERKPKQILSSRCRFVVI